MKMKLNVIKYEQHKTWYSDATVELRKQYGKDYKLFAGLLSAISPRMQVKRNWEVTIKVYGEYKKGRINLKRIHQPAYQKQFMKRFGIMNSHMQNIARAFRGEPLSGNKVSSFYNNLTGNLNSVTIDTWMQKFFKEEKLTTVKYRSLSDKTTVIAEKFDMKPAEMQAIIWTQIREEAGYKPVTFTEMMI